MKRRMRIKSTGTTKGTFSNSLSYNGAVVTVNNSVLLFEILLNVTLSRDILQSRIKILNMLNTSRLSPGHIVFT